MAIISTTPEFSREEVGLVLRNPGMQLEGLRYPVTPIGMHYLLIHFDIPHIDPATYNLWVTGRVSNPLELSIENICAPEGHHAGDDGVRRQRAGAPLSASRLRPVARRGGRVRRVDGHPPAPDTRRSRPDRRCRRGTFRRL
jgi:hypothetical protein